MHANDKLGKFLSKTENGMSLNSILGFHKLKVKEKASLEKGTKSIRREIILGFCSFFVKH